MPRPKKPGAPEPKKRSRHGCWPCKNKKVKCGEEKPKCLNCERQGEPCDYSIRLNWEGRTKRKATESTPEPTPHGLPLQDPAPMVPEGQEASPLPVKMEHLWDAQATREGQEQYECGTSNSAQPTSLQLSSRDGFDASQISRLQGTSHSFGSSQALYHLETTRAQVMPPPPSSSQSQTTIFNSMLPPPYSSPNPQMLNNAYGYEIGIVNYAPDEANQAKRRRVGPPSDLQVVPHNKTDQLSVWESLSTPSPDQLPTPSASSEMSHASTGKSGGYQLAFSAQPSPATLVHPDSPRRLSVNSLLRSPTQKELGNQVSLYGIDRGFPDLDIRRNEDANVLVRTAPLSHNGSFSEEPSLQQPEFGFGLSTQSEDGYYARPVSVTIPKSLEPLPWLLLDNQMNLLYFHHFLNHTARILVPHDCAANPFRIILPLMAVQDDNLMRLLLAYSASHRARLLKHAEPSVRIAEWVDNVFPALRHAVDNPAAQLSNTTLATTIMFASLEIVAPSFSKLKVSWQEHLKAARKIIKMRGTPQPGHSDTVGWFLSRWFTYLDVLGSLSGARNTPVISEDEWSSGLPLPSVGAEIDCLFGFTSSCAAILGRIADLAGRCDTVRIDRDGNINEDWQPQETIVERAEELKACLEAAHCQPYRGCPHRNPGPDIGVQGFDDDEMAATNDAYHWAGLIHLTRRVLGKPSEDSAVQDAVRNIVDSLVHIRRGGTAEACLLFPMFTAGCDARDAYQRELIMERMKSVESTGMFQVRRDYSPPHMYEYYIDSYVEAHKARTLMERVWETGKPWETLVQGEFFG